MRQHYDPRLCDLGSSGVAPLELQHALAGDWSRLDGLALTDGEPTGSRELRLEVAAAWGSGDPEEVLVTHGASEALFLAYSTLLEPGHHVVAQRPAYHALRNLPLVHKCVLHDWEIPLDGRRPNLDELHDLVALVRPAVVALNFPHNPTGVSLTVTERTDLWEILSSSNALLLWDASFTDLTFDRRTCPPVYYEDLPRGSVYVGSASKSLGAPGLRLGWMIAPRETIASCLPFRDMATLHLSPLVEKVGRCLLAQREAIIAENQAILDFNLRHFLDRLAEDDVLVCLTVPDGGTTAFPAVNNGENTRTIAHYLANRDVLTVPGDCFGETQRLRIGLGAEPPDRFRRGLDVLLSVLHSGRSAGC